MERESRGWVGVSRRFEIHSLAIRYRLGYKSVRCAFHRKQTHLLLRVSRRERDDPAERHGLGSRGEARGPGLGLGVHQRDKLREGRDLGVARALDAGAQHDKVHGETRIGEPGGEGLAFAIQQVGLRGDEDDDAAPGASLGCEGRKAERREELGGAAKAAELALGYPRGELGAVGRRGDQHSGPGERRKRERIGNKRFEEQ